MVTFRTYLDNVLPSHLTDAEKVIYLQKAYEYVVEKIRLDISLLPIRFSKHIRLGTLSYPAVMVTSGSAIAVKQIKAYTKCTIQPVQPLILGAIDTCLVGNLHLADYGYTDFNLVNDERAVVPSIYSSGLDISCDNTDDAFMLLQCYVYPYFLKTVNGFYVDNHSYDIATMLALYGADNLLVDDMLGVLMMLAAKQIYSKQNLLPAVESYMQKFLHILLNVHNLNTGTLDVASYSSMGTADSHGAFSVSSG